MRFALCESSLHVFFVRSCFCDLDRCNLEGLFAVVRTAYCKLLLKSVKIKVMEIAFLTWNGTQNIGMYVVVSESVNVTMS